MSDKEPQQWMRAAADKIEDALYDLIDWDGYEEEPATLAPKIASIIAAGCPDPLLEELGHGTERTPAELPTLEEWLQGLYPGADLDRLEIPARVVIEIAKSYAKALVAPASGKYPIARQCSCPCHSESYRCEHCCDGATRERQEENAQQ